VQQFVIQQPQQQQAQQQPGNERKLSLSREQMLEAQDMFKNSNKVTRPEKALILGFMAGSRENPCPHLGNVVTIKLSENIERLTQPDGTEQNVLAETHYQMNYLTGEGKRIKKCRLITAVVQQMPQQPGQGQAQGQQQPQQQQAQQPQAMFSQPV
jgi:negative elongation factor A